MQLGSIWSATTACNSRHTALLKGRTSQIKSSRPHPPSLDKGLTRARSHLNSRKNSNPQMKTVKLLLTQELSPKPFLFLKRKSSLRREVQQSKLVQSHQKKIKQASYSKCENIMNWRLPAKRVPSRHLLLDFKYGVQML